MKDLAKRIRLGLLGLLAVAAASGNASAQPCTPASLSNYLMGSCTVGNTTFSDLLFSPTSGGSGVAPAAADITVAPEMSADGPGLIFSSSAITVSQGTAITSDTFVDVTLAYTVTAASGYQIDDANLALAGTIDGAGEGNVTEFLSASSTSLSVALPATTDMVVFPTSVDAVDVLNDILVEVPAGQTGSADVTSVSQQLSQVSTVPEPPTIVILSIGLLGLALVRRGSGWVEDRKLVTT